MILVLLPRPCCLQQLNADLMVACSGQSKKKELQSVLSLPENYEIQLVLAFGYPAEEVVLEEVDEDGKTNY
jgi:hypothetical protein